MNFRSKLTSDKVGLCTSEKYVPDNVGVAAGILFLSVQNSRNRGGNSTPPPGGYKRVEKIGGYTKDLI